MTQDEMAAGELVLTGALTMRSAEAICGQLRAAIAGHRSVSIDCATATDVDLTFIQLLIAARTSAQFSDKPIGLAVRPDGALLDALTRAGFGVMSMDQFAGADAFWFEEVRA